MNRKTLLNETIAKAEEIKDWQLVKWLYMVRDGGNAIGWYMQKNDQLKAENDKLRKQLAQARDPQRIGGTAIPDSFVYAIEQLREFRWQHATNDEDVIPYINNVAVAHDREKDMLKAENDKLREDMEDLEGYDQMLRDRLRQETELKVKVKKKNAKLRKLVEDMWFCGYNGYIDNES